MCFDVSIRPDASTAGGLIGKLGVGCFVILTGPMHLLGLANAVSLRRVTLRKIGTGAFFIAGILDAIGGKYVHAGIYIIGVIRFAQVGEAIKEMYHFDFAGVTDGPTQLVNIMISDNGVTCTLGAE